MLEYEFNHEDDEEKHILVLLDLSDCSRLLIVRGAHEHDVANNAHGDDVVKVPPSQAASGEQGSRKAGVWGAYFPSQ